MPNTSPEPSYPFVHVDVEPELVDTVSFLLFELGATGVEERDDTTYVKALDPELVTLVASFDTWAEAEEACESLDPVYSPRIEEVVGDSWRDAWKEHFHPLALTERIVVRPPWEDVTSKKPGQIVLVLEPGRAFGTGLHETTSLVANVLDERAPEFSGRPLLDVGTGSGILALVALALGASAVRAVDTDADSIDVARENAARNELGERLFADTSPIEAISDTYPVVVANIETDVLVALSDSLKRAVAPGGLLVLSGILIPQKAEVLRAYASLTVEDAPTDGEWVALVLRKAE